MPNEIQTVTITNYSAINEFSFFSLNWENYRPEGAPGSSFGVGTSGPIDGLTANQFADMVETEFNSQLPPDSNDRTISVIGSLDGDTLTLTLTFDGPGIADTNVDQGTAADWGDMDEPTLATIQEGGESAPEFTPKLGRGGFGNMSHGNGFN